MLIKLPKVNYLSPDYQGFLINIAGRLTILGQKLSATELFDEYALV